VSDLSSDTYEKIGIIGTLVVFGSAIIRWLLSERKEVLKKLKESEERERSTSEKRAADLKQASELLSESGKFIEQSNELVRIALADNTRTLQDNIKALERLERETESLKDKLNEFSRLKVCSSGS